MFSGQKKYTHIYKYGNAYFIYSTYYLLVFFIMRRCIIVCSGTKFSNIYRIIGTFVNSISMPENDRKKQHLFFAIIYRFMSLLAVPCRCRPYHAVPGAAGARGGRARAHCFQRAGESAGAANRC